MDRLPWIPYSAKGFLDGIVKPFDKVFEWGCGGSTLYFSDRCASVVSVDDNEEWHDKVLPRVGKHVTLRLIMAEQGKLGVDLSDPAHYCERNTGDVNFKAYADEICKYDDESFDIIMVDGQARPSCIVNALPKLKRGGWLILDNSDRTFYLSQVGYLLNGWDKRQFCGNGPYNTYEWCCTFWRKP